MNYDILTQAQKTTLNVIHVHNIDAFNEDMTDGYANKNYPYAATFSFRQENKAPPYKLWFHGITGSVTTCSNQNVTN